MVLAGLKLTFPSEASLFTNLYKSQGLVGRADRLLSWQNFMNLAFHP